MSGIQHTSSGMADPMIPSNDLATPPSGRGPLDEREDFFP
jgi:hypothetical protein